MKILMVTMSMNIGGAETHILELCRELVSRGEDVTLASFGGVYAEEAVHFGVKHVKMPLHTKNPVSVVRSYCGLRELILRERFDIVHAHARIPAFICGLIHDSLSLDGYKFRFVTSAHLDFRTGPLWRSISRWGERVMAVSDDIAEYLTAEYGYPPERIYKTVNGIDTAKFSPDTAPAPVLQQWGLEASRRRIVYMSRLDPDRSGAAFTLLEIAPLIHQRYPECDIVIVGGGDDLAKIKAEAERINANVGRTLVTVTGAVSNTNEYCAAADVFIGVSRSALEAMSSACPVIVAGNQGALGIFDESKVSAAVSTNFCCRGFDCESAEAMLCDISRLLDMNDSERAKMCAYNRNFILENYTMRRMADDYLEMYGDAVVSPRQFFGKPDIVISGYYGFGNLGDESLLDAIARSTAEAYPGIKLAALTRRPCYDSKRTGLRCVSRFNIPSVFRMLAGAKLLISGGGSLLQDTTSNRSLRYYVYILRMAKRLGCRTFVYANGIGPINHASNKKLAARAVSSADAVSVRDSGSKLELISLGVVESKVRLSADPAFTIRSAERERSKEILSSLGVRGEYFAVSIRPLQVRGGESVGNEDENEAVADKISAACIEIAEGYGLCPLLVPMQFSADATVCDSIVEKLIDNGVSAAVYKPRSAAELMGVLSGARFALAMRLHAVIFASSVGCPVIGISYDPKVKAIMRELGQPYCADLKRDCVERTLAEEITGFVAEVDENQNEIRRALHENSERMRSLCTGDTAEIGRLIYG